MDHSQDRTIRPCGISSLISQEMQVQHKPMEPIMLEMVMILGEPVLLALSKSAVACARAKGPSAFVL